MPRIPEPIIFQIKTLGFKKNIPVKTIVDEIKERFYKIDENIPYEVRINQAWMDIYARIALGDKESKERTNKQLIFRKILGKPGSGKTTYIANQILHLLQNGVKIDDIMFTTYSRSASRAIYQKLAEQGFSVKRLSNFGTVYSLANRVLGFTKENYIMPKDYELFANMMNMDFDTSAVISDISSIDDAGNIPIGGKAEANALYVWFSLLKCMYVDDNVILEKISTMSDLRWQERQFLMKYPIDTIVKFYKHWQLYKKNINKWEYEDLLQIICKRKIPYHVPIKYIFIDETHDFGKLQMAVLRIWWKAPSVKEVIACYDPMQTIYRFTGSSPEHIESIQTDDYHVLNKSYRVPESPWNFATYLAESIGDTSMRDVASSGKKGSLSFISGLKDVIDDLEGTTYLLARTNTQVRSLIDECSKNSIPVIGIGRNNTPWNYPKFKNIYNLFVKLIQEKDPNLTECQAFISELKAKNVLKRGVKSKIVKHPELIWNKSDNKTEVFFDMFEKIKTISALKQHIQTTNDFSITKQQYLRNTGQKSELVHTISVFAGTLHASKGLQANNVIISDYHPRTDSNPIDETKLAYVGITRTIDNCFIIENEGFYGNLGFIKRNYAHYRSQMRLKNE